MSARVRTFEDGIEDEVARWPGAAVEFGRASKHKLAVITFRGSTRKVFYPSSPSDCGHGLHNKLKDVRRELRFLGAARTPVPKSGINRKKSGHHGSLKPGAPTAREDRFFAPLAAIRATMELS